MSVDTNKISGIKVTPPRSETLILVEFDFTPSGCPIFPAHYTAASLGAAAASLDATSSPPPPLAPSPPPSMPCRRHRLPRRCHHPWPRCHFVAAGPALLRCVPLLLRLVLWALPSAPILALVSPSTFHRFRLGCER
jgi:hypothetical protein